MNAIHALSQLSYSPIRKLYFLPIAALSVNNFFEY